MSAVQRKMASASLRIPFWLGLCLFLAIALFVLARLFSGLLAKLNPLVRALYVPTTGWNPDRDLVADMDQVFGNVTVETFNAGSSFVAWAQKSEIEP